MLHLFRDFVFFLLGYSNDTYKTLLKYVTTTLLDIMRGTVFSNSKWLYILLLYDVNFFICLAIISFLTIFIIPGFSSVIPGYPRYTMFGDRRHGVYNLRIVNASLEDDAEYQCQVGPAQMHKVIRANATLTVICKYFFKYFLTIHTQTTP